MPPNIVDESGGRDYPNSPNYLPQHSLTHELLCNGTCASTVRLSDTYENEIKRVFGVLASVLAKCSSGYLFGDKATVADLRSSRWARAQQPVWMSKAETLRRTCQSPPSEARYSLVGFRDAEVTI